ncbi:MAG: ABC transporter permease [Clostridiales bacterium]|nr:ABC transporter permease [Clostridiales bacterium]MBR5040988.1 ABC transporter permease [Clostridiales bacterium]MBR5058555.1 ABC transporter permease [Clostridiales bacterium]
MEIRQKLKNFIKNKWAVLCRRTHYVLLGIPFVFATAGLVLGVASVIRINQVLDRQSFQYAAEQYESKVMPYRQMTVLGPGLAQGDGSAARSTEEGLNIEKVKSLHEALDITERSTVGDSGKGQGKGSVIVNPWKDCYSTTATYAAKGMINKEETGSVDSCEIVGVGGDYASIHPFIYESGGFLQQDEPGRLSIVLNTQMAWNLFRSYQVLGAFVEINGTIYSVVGVVNDGTDELSETVGATKPRAYIQFSQLASLANGGFMPTNSMETDSAVKEEDLAITCYEVLMMDPIKNIAFNDLKKALSDTVSYSEDTSKLVLINNTDRFNVISLFKKYFPLKKSYVGGDGISVPYYERSARLAEQYVVFWAEALVVGIFFVIVGGCNIYAIIHGKKPRHKMEEAEDDNEFVAEDEKTR